MNNNDYKDWKRRFRREMLDTVLVFLTLGGVIFSIMVRLPISIAPMSDWLAEAGLQVAITALAARVGFRD